MQETAAHSKNARTIGSLFKRFRRDREGVVAIEFILCAFPFFFLIFAILETAIVFASGIVLENGVKDVARQVLTGQLQTLGNDAPGEEDFRKLVCDEVSYFLACDKLEIDLQTFDTFSDIDLTYDPDNFGYSLGGSDQISVLRVYYKREWLTSILHGISEDDDGKIIISSVSAFRNEPF
ncbi:TadE/TadG family type IV pilus assembly protein [Fulvimarina sp. MAC3]|uniref:TadE/TadG family type IV pilus assembly protein n=1 Tax=Fulvimarina sp. MAC3 TaxID=3148887 RepID=UPI0031FC9062